MFRLDSIKFIGHEVFGDQEVIFSFDGYDGERPLFSTVIGANGTGKSQMLRAIIEIFNADISANNNQSQYRRRLDYCYELNYTISGTQYSISKHKAEKKYSYSVLGQPTPSKILASAFTVNDKYPFLNKSREQANGCYKYIGIRSTSNNAFINKHQSDFIDNLHLILKDRKKTESLLNLFDKLGLPSDFRISLAPGKRFSLFKKKVLMNFKIANFSANWTRYIESQAKKSSGDFRDDKFDQLLKNKEYINSLSHFINGNISKVEALDFGVDLKNPSDAKEFIDGYKSIELMRSAELLKVKDVTLTEKGYSFNEMSSGEFHIISTLTSIIAHLEDNCLILIDEPEISLHPNWQIQYIDLLETILASYPTCHVVIATHSHFLISNLNKNYASIIAATRDKRTPMFRTLEASALGWSADQVLYEVFGIASSRNHYFDMDVRKLISFSEGSDVSKEAVKKALSRVSKFKLSNDDPLLMLINSVRIQLNGGEL